MNTCCMCNKTDKKVTRKQSVPQSLFGDWKLTSTGCKAKPAKNYFYHEKCYEAYDEKCRIELFGK